MVSVYIQLSAAVVERSADLGQALRFWEKAYFTEMTESMAFSGYMRFVRADC